MYILGLGWPTSSYGLKRKEVSYVLYTGHSFCTLYLYIVKRRLIVSVARYRYIISGLQDSFRFRLNVLDFTAMFSFSYARVSSRIIRCEFESKFSIFASLSHLFASGRRSILGQLWKEAGRSKSCRRLAERKIERRSEKNYFIGGT